MLPILRVDERLMPADGRLWPKLELANECFVPFAATALAHLQSVKMDEPVVRNNDPSLIS